jgi:hypothetical protein
VKCARAKGVIEAKIPPHSAGKQRRRKFLKGDRLMRKNLLLTAALLGVLVLPACMQQPAPAPAPAQSMVRIRGTVDALQNQTLIVNTHPGQASIALASNYAVLAVVRRPLGSIKPGDYIASTSILDKDGKLHATEVHIFPESMRGTGEGQFPWDRYPNSLMTNATVGKVTKTASGGRVLTVTYKGQSSDIVVGPKVPVVGYVPGSPGLLSRGKAVFVVAQKYSDGSMTAGRVTVEKNGVKPPM